MIGQGAAPFSQPGVVRDHHAAFPRGDLFVGIKAKDRARPNPPTGRPEIRPPSPSQASSIKGISWRAQRFQFGHPRRVAKGLSRQDGSRQLQQLGDRLKVHIEGPGRSPRTEAWP